MPRRHGHSIGPEAARGGVIMHHYDQTEWRFTMSEQELRLEAVKTAARVSSPYDDVANLLVHARWIADFIQTGRSPASETAEA